MTLNLTDLDLLQQDCHDWRTRNFPNADSTQQLLGVVEEVGELSHAHLKAIQGIRGMDDEAASYEAKVDAVGDILIYLMGYCSYEGIHMRTALEQTWHRVGQRDWITDPQSAGEATQAMDADNAVWPAAGFGDRSYMIDEEKTVDMVAESNRMLGLNES